MKVFFYLISIALLSSCAPKAAVDRDQSMVDELVAEYRPQIDECFQAEAEKNPEISGGRILIRADHLPDGRLVNIRKLKSFPGSGPIFDCISRLMKNWKTDRPYTHGSIDLIWDFERRTSG